MRLDLWTLDLQKQIYWLPSHIGGYILVCAYLLVLFGVVQRSRRDWQQDTHGRLAGWLAALALGLVASGLFLVYLPEPEILPVPNLPQILPVPAAPLFGGVTILLVGGWLGVGPAVTVGLASGVARTLLLTGRGVQVLEVALLAALGAWLLRQNYRGVFFAWLRRPIVAGVITGITASLLAFASFMSSTALDSSFLSIVDFAFSLAKASFFPNLLEWTLAGVLVEIVFARMPGLASRTEELVPPPYDYSLTHRFLFLFIPTFMLMIVILVVVVTSITIRSATDLTLEQMSHDGRVASGAIPDITIISSNLLQRFAEQDLLVSGEQPAVMEYALNLESDLRSTAYFRQLVLLDRAGEVVSAFPPVDRPDSIPLTAEEIAAAEQAITMRFPLNTQIWSTPENIPILSQMEPILDGDGNAVGVLMGRVDLGVALAPIVDSLQGTLGLGRGFIVDGQSTIIADPNADMLTQLWVPPHQDEQKSLNDRLPGADNGQAYEHVSASGTRQLVYFLKGEAHPWTVVVTMPHEQVLSLATQVAGPLALALLVVGGLMALGLALLARQLTQPLSALATAAGAMAQRDLDTPVQVHGVDEVGRLGRTFEQMRQALRNRLSELQLLLGVSQSVASSLDLSHGVPPILEGALQATGADGARVVAFAGRERGPVTFQGGELGSVMAPLDITLARLAQREPVLKYENTTRARDTLNIDRLADRVGAILALPLRTSQGYQGVLWVGYRRPRTFTDSEIGFLSTLASQASMLIENTQLFEAAEGGRRRLAAILASTSDAVIVTDPQDRVLLLNPAAEAAFGLSATQVIEQPVGEVLDHPDLVSLLMGIGDNNTREVTLAGGRVMYASASSISSDDKQVMGRVTVLRDITHLKELDEMKTEFVSTVSHDLRSPLTYMRGYVTMLPMIGELSSKQTEYVDKILTGVDQMTELVEDLLSLGRIESDVSHMAEPVQIGSLARATAEGYRARAMGKGLGFQVEVAENLPTVIGDPALLRQAISNLVDNAIKYTPAGEIKFRVSAGEERVVIQVQDTGPGISQADQMRLFEKFFRVKRRESLDIKGSGLGLAIVKSIVERRHNGRVWVESQLGVGTSFFIALPIGHQ